jgi:hypothetical protein
MLWLSESFCRVYFIQIIYRKEYLQSLYYAPRKMIVEENSKNSDLSKFIYFTTEQSDRQDAKSSFNSGRLLSIYSLDNDGALYSLESPEDTAIEDYDRDNNYLGDNLANIENNLKASAFDLPTNNRIALFN